jgi:hypothetical protein
MDFPLDGIFDWFCPLLNFADLLLVDESFTTALLLCQATVLFS